jgi:sugar-specific transcriptional regulator TrmB
LVENLEDLGLQIHEAMIYVALLELGKGTVTEISRKAGLNRTTGYDVLERLCLYGLANRSTLDSKKRIYLSEPPTRLKQYLENKKLSYERRINELKDLMPDLQSLHKTELKPVIKFAEGKEAMENIYLHVLDAKSTVYSIVNLKNYAESFGDFGDYQMKERNKRGIMEKLLSLDNDTARWWYNKTYKDNKKNLEFTEYNWVGNSNKNSPCGEVLVFDDRVIGMLSKPDENVAFEIQSQTFADFLKMVFEMAWSKNSK